MTSVIMLFIELLLDIVGLVTGGIIWAHSSESKIRKAWGMLATTLSLLLLCDNIELSLIHISLAVLLLRRTC